ncbi:uncharacterized protein EV420DRAFT_1654075 [Desarmillaria tabescens]|uniref:Uncharacterized protein n=1 Tax=Armillaria tabescens TaxID=1929756 RepID=A0AA39MI35_ARMTA|nr:uncharacterized protein EV420DRAFT_1654075 [Desarmillaria tabescens]KAK0434270.1 hypothetical protein EV420DRAFT_1654075 [Desarmillaria tabescens]
MFHGPQRTILTGVLSDTIGALRLLAVDHYPVIGLASSQSEEKFPSESKAQLYPVFSRGKEESSSSRSSPLALKNYTFGGTTALVLSAFSAPTIVVVSNSLATIFLRLMVETRFSAYVE